MPEVNLQFELPRRQHGIGIVVLIGWRAQMLIRSLWPVLLAAWVQQDDEARYLQGSFCCCLDFGLWRFDSLLIHIQCEGWEISRAQRGFCA